MVSHIIQCPRRRGVRRRNKGNRGGKKNPIVFSGSRPGGWEKELKACEQGGGRVQSQHDGGRPTPAASVKTVTARKRASTEQENELHLRRRGRKQRDWRSRKKKRKNVASTQRLAIKRGEGRYRPEAISAKKKEKVKGMRRATLTRTGSRVGWGRRGKAGPSSKKGEKRHDKGEKYMVERYL